MARTKAIVRDQSLIFFTEGREQRIEVDSPSWYAWLEKATTFAFVSNVCVFTARKELRQHGRFYWRAYCKKNGKLRHIYLGRSVNLTIERLQAVATEFAIVNDGSLLYGMQRDSKQISLHSESGQIAVNFDKRSFHEENTNEQHFSLGATSIKAHPYTLPISPTILIGREQEQSAVLSLLGRLDVRLITLIGTGGVGKTRLALEVAHTASNSYSDGALFVSLASVHHSDQVMHTIAQALGLRETGDRRLSEYVRDVLRNKHLLLLLDNFEQVVEAGSQLSNLLLYCPYLKILVTSRTALRISFEYEFTVSPLAIADPTRYSSEEDLKQLASVRLFIERASSNLSLFQLQHDDVRLISEICSRLDGLPLAIELAATHVKFLPLQTLLKRLSRRLDILTGGARDFPIRQQAMRNTIQWSYDLLDAQEQRLFRSLSVFAGGCTLEAATAAMEATNLLNNAISIQDREVLDVCTSLVEKHLIQQIMWQEEEPRLLMLETIREYGLERLQSLGELQVVKYAHALYYLQLATKAYGYLFQAKGVRWFQKLEQEYANLRVAILWLLEREEEEATEGIEYAVQLSSVLWRFWTVRGHLSEGRTLLERMLSASERSGDETRKKVLLNLGTILWYQNDFVRMEEVIIEQLHLCQMLGDRQGIAHTLIGLSGLARRQRDYNLACSLAEESLSISRKLGDSWRTAVALSLLGRLASATGEHTKARQYLEESIEIYRKLGYPGDIAWPLIYLARDSIMQEDHLRARAILEEALSLCRIADDKWGLSTSLSFLGQEMLEQGELARARTLLSECFLLAQELGNLRSVAWACYLLASVLMLLGEKMMARRLFNQGLVASSTLKHTGLICSCLQGLAAIMVLDEQFHLAVRLFGAAASLDTGNSNPSSSLLHAHIKQSRTIARKQMGSADFAHTLTQGRAMGVEQVLALREFTEMPMLNKQENVPTDPKKSNFDGLTARELEVLRLITQGLTSAQVAAQLFISSRTVSTHLTSIYNKMGVGSRTAAVRFAIKYGLV